MQPRFYHPEMLAKATAGWLTLQYSSIGVFGTFRVGLSVFCHGQLQKYQTELVSDVWYFNDVGEIF